jgi:hypothetical protein
MDAMYVSVGSGAAVAVQPTGKVEIVSLLLEADLLLGDDLAQLVHRVPAARACHGMKNKGMNQQNN